MKDGLPTNLPIGVVDLDNTSQSRNVIRNLDAFSQTQVIETYANIADARKDVQNGTLYGFYYIPKNFSQEAQARKQPNLSFYTNYSY